MSEYIPDFGEDSEEPEDVSAEGMDEPDPALVARLDQEEAAFAAEREKWLKVYGFDHDCTCGQDYASGKTTEVTYCFMRLTNQALRRSAEATQEVNALSNMLGRLVTMNNDLISMMEELGHTEELQKYFSDDEPLQEEVETTDLDAEFEQLILLGEPDEDDNDDEELAGV